MVLPHNPLELFTQFLPIWLMTGACIGSFLSMLAYRVPKILAAEAAGERTDASLLTRSACAHCGAPLKWYHNLPVVGFLLVHRSTPCCAKPVPLRYLTFEATAIAISLLTWTLFKGNVAALWGWSAFLWVLLVSSYVDAKSQWLPDIFTQPLLWIGLLFSALSQPWLLPTQILTVVGLYVVLRVFVDGYAHLRGRDGLGGGDIKLITAFGAWFPYTTVLYIVLGACVVQAVAMMALRTRQAAFGPALGSAAFVAFLLGQLA